MTARIDPENVRGIWPPWLPAWRDDWSLDEPSSYANLDRLIAGVRPGAGGLYTLDTASEFYDMEFEEWHGIAQRFVRHCRAAKVRFPLGLGCTWTGQRGALKRVATARDLGVAVIHLSAPYWLPLDEDGLVRFYAAVQEEAGHLGVIVYAPPHGKVRLTAPLYRRLVAAAPCVIGSKTVGDDTELLCEPGSHFVGEQRFVVGCRAGATGSYSSLAGMSPRFMNEWFAMIQDGRWAQAQARQEAVERYYRAGVQPIRDRHILAGAIDKAQAQAGGATGSRRLRPPYPSVPDDLMTAMLAAAKEHIPQALG